MPFVGFWVGYVYSPEKVVEVEKIVEVEIPVVETESNGTDETSLIENEDQASNVYPLEEEIPVDENADVKSMLELSRNQIEIIKSEQNLEGYENVCKDAQVYKILLTLSQSYEKPLTIKNDDFNDDYSITCNDSADGFLITAPIAGKTCGGV